MRDTAAVTTDDTPRGVSSVDDQHSGIVDALLRVVESGQRIVLDRFELAQFDLTQLAAHTLRGAPLIAVGALLVAGAWFVLMGGVVVWLHQYLPLPSSLLVVAGGSALFGAAAIAVGVRRVRIPDALDVGRGALARGARGADRANGHDRP